MRRMPLPMSQSANDRNTETRTTMTNTIKVVMRVSFQDGHVTLAVSWRTSWTNFAGLVLAMRCYPEGSKSSVSHYGVLAGVEGLEPPAPGFGDRCSTN